jgi:hypothetical protein
MFGSINAAQTQDDLRATQLLIMFGPHIAEPNIIHPVHRGRRNFCTKKIPTISDEDFPM